MAGRLRHPIFGVDSYGMTPPSIQHAIYSRFIVRYSAHMPGKAITEDEARMYKAADIDIVSVFEDGAGNALMGYDQGREDGMFAEQQTREAGRPSGRPVFFAVDEDVNEELSRLDAYFAGVATVMGKENCGPYGSADVCSHFFQQGFGWGYQTLAWSGGEVDERAQIYQYAINLNIRGVQIDYDHAYYEDYGQWFYKRSDPDPMHYDRYFMGPFEYKGHKLHERDLVMECDHLARHPRVNRKKLAAVRKELALCADRIRGLAAEHREKDKTLPPEWAPFWRWWRYPRIANRAMGKVYHA